MSLARYPVTAVFTAFILSIFFAAFTPITADAFEEKDQHKSSAASEAIVRSNFADLPVMVEIARCESKFRQYTDAGNPLMGGYGNRMVGVFQLYSNIHERAAAALGHDIYTLDGNLGYARHLYEQSGTNPWQASSHCWSEPVSTIGSESDAELLARITELLALIETLQAQLARRELVAR